MRKRKQKIDWIPYIIVGFSLYNSFTKFVTTDYSTLNILSFGYVSIIVTSLLAGIRVKRFCDNRTKNGAYFITNLFSWGTIYSSIFLLAISVFVWSGALTINDSFEVIFFGNLTGLNNFWNSYCHLPFLKLNGCMFIYLLSSLFLAIANVLKTFLENQVKR